MLDHSSRSFRKIALAAAGASTVLVLAACSGGGGTGSGPETQTPRGQETVTVTEAPSETAQTTTTSSADHSAGPQTSSVTARGSSQAPDNVVGDNPVNSRIGGTEPGKGSPVPIEVAASGSQLSNGGFDEAWIEFLDDGANGLLRFPMIDGLATVRVNLKFKANSMSSCQATMEVYDADGYESLAASSRVHALDGNSCNIQAGPAFSTGDSQAEFSEPGEYYIVVQAQQADHDPIRLAQKVLITSGELSDGRG